ncbi:AAA family ATPase [Vibrio sp. LaRot3]|uniref:AAA family ATPase n=1 Tax=Vibrio sp. LaRot3 TaxID=2998829 RepID=UPI0022CDD594|nr:AAA family ATPase [Vibrio sp. LaRot3]MDA0150201.1 AAA family ATPase [Vibrio sp. LaRot3]
MTKLYIFSGLPASGKSTLAKRLAKHYSAMYIRIDSVEQGLRDLCNYSVEGEGYRLSYRLIRDNLLLGNSAIADSCNPIPLTREEWQQVAIDANADFINIEVSCSDMLEHQHRVENRVNEVANLQLPTWQQVLDREYHPWSGEVIRIDTAGQTIEASFCELLDKLEKRSLKGSWQRNKERCQ